MKLIRTAKRETAEGESEYSKRMAVRNECMIELLYSLGLGIEEIAALNVEDYNVQELLGHKSIVTTQIYTEVSLYLYREKYVLGKYNGRNFLQCNS